MIRQSMWNNCSTTKGDPAPSGTLTLATVWHVRADRSYAVARSSPGARCLVAIRTLGGRGRLEFNSGETTDVECDTLLVVDNRHLRRYWCAMPVWHFWWFEFNAPGAVTLPLAQRIPIPSLSGEGAAMNEIFRVLRKNEFRQKSLASAAFGLLLHRWMALSNNDSANTVHHATMERVVDAMHARTAGGWTVHEMAQFSGLSERRFRQVFEETMGQSPKQFYDGIRLELGRQILSMEFAKIAVVAERLGFSSAFHFSRAFRQHFGMPPSHARRKRPAQACP